MAALPDGLDWSAWTVDVHDAKRLHVAFVDFIHGVAAAVATAALLRAKVT